MSDPLLSSYPQQHYVAAPTTTPISSPRQLPYSTSKYLTQSYPVPWPFPRTFDEEDSLSPVSVLSSLVEGGVVESPFSNDGSMIVGCETDEEKFGNDEMGLDSQWAGNHGASDEERGGGFRVRNDINQELAVAAELECGRCEQECQGKGVQWSADTGVGNWNGNS
ncbi:hypothetical protein HK097_002269, partial [Rhizophlyctis rosea]